MKIAILSIQVPFIRGGAEACAGELQKQLVRRGHQADIVTFPFRSRPTRSLLDCMAQGEQVDLEVGEGDGETIDLVIPLKFPAYFLRHPNKVVWLLHQHRPAYDLWGTEFADMDRWPDGEELRRNIIESDRRHLTEAQGVFTISKNVSSRLRRYNGVDSTVLYHPPRLKDRLRCTGYEDFIYFPSRVHTIKRQHVLVEAARHLQGSTQIVLSGAGPEIPRLEALVKEHGLGRRVKILGHVTDEEMIDLYARCLAVYFGPFDEDYGYVSLEAQYSGKAIITHADSGGPMEFVRDQVNGLVVRPEPLAVAASIDRLQREPGLARALGEQARADILERDINWDRVIDALTAGAPAQRGTSTAAAPERAPRLQGARKCLLVAPPSGVLEMEPLLRDLGESFDLTLLHGNGGNGDDASVAPEDLGAFDDVLYFLGAEPERYAAAYAAFVRRPGPVVLDDLDLTDLVVAHHRPQPDFYAALYALLGPAAVARARRTVKGWDRPEQEDAVRSAALAARVVSRAPMIFIRDATPFQGLDPAVPVIRLPEKATPGAGASLVIVEALRSRLLGGPGS